jgi:hypothetical protein
MQACPVGINAQHTPTMQACLVCAVTQSLAVREITMIQRQIGYLLIVSNESTSSIGPDHKK